MCRECKTGRCSTPFSCMCKLGPDLYTALTEGSIAGAGLDVLCKEPMDPENPLLKIQDSNKLIITPHIAWAAKETRFRVVDEVVKNIQRFQRDDRTNRVY